MFLFYIVYEVIPEDIKQLVQSASISANFGVNCLEGTLKYHLRLNEVSINFIYISNKIIHAGWCLYLSALSRTGRATSSFTHAQQKAALVRLQTLFISNEYCFALYSLI